MSKCNCAGKLYVRVTRQNIETPYQPVLIATEVWPVMLGSYDPLVRWTVECIDPMWSN